MMTGANGGPARIVNIVAAIERCAAVCGHLEDTCTALAAAPGWQVAILASRRDPDARRELPARLVSGVAQLLLDRDFLSADLLIYHFAGWDPLFDAVIVGNGRARQAVIVHPLQPVERAAIKERRLAVRSFAQLSSLRRADRLWPTDRESAELLAARGFDPARIELPPLAASADRSVASSAEPRPAHIEALIRDRVAALLSAGAGTTA